MTSHFLTHRDEPSKSAERNVSFEALYLGFVVMQTKSAYIFLRENIECYLLIGRQCPDGSVIFGGITEEQLRKSFEDTKAKD